MDYLSKNVNFVVLIILIILIFSFVFYGCGEDSISIPNCGNGIIDSGENCDKAIKSGIGVCPTDCDDNNPCTEDNLNGSVNDCSAICTNEPIQACINDDNCCLNICDSTNDNDCSASCGNGNIEDNETCDGNCPVECNDSNSCTSDTMNGSAQNCNVSCSYQAINECNDGDGCCPAGCNTANDSDCSAFCGNGVVDTNETCDGNCLTECNDGNACTDDIMLGSVQNCNVSCSYQTINECNDGDGCCPAGCNTASDSDCSPFCGNNVIDANETCDGNCPDSCNDGNICTNDTMLGSAQNCNVSCSYQAINECNDGDGCCPAGCNTASDSDCSAFCGNGVIDANETCDKNCPVECKDGNTCTIDSMTGSAENCNVTCSYQPINECYNGDGCCPMGCNTANDSDCSAFCGNGVVDANETCDGNCPVSCVDGNACTIDSMTGSSQNCNTTCSYHTINECLNNDGCCPSGCTYTTDNDCSNLCGNKLIDEGETCDGNCPATCNDNNPCTIDLMTGTPENCNVSCSYEVINECGLNDGCCPSGCNNSTDSDCSSNCGNGQVEENETCDGNCPTTCNDNISCTIDIMTGSAENCNVTCSYQPITACLDGDNCCAIGCNSSLDDDCDPGTGLLGDSCVSYVDCATNGCIEEAIDGWTNGYCSEGCRTNADCSSNGHCGFIVDGIGVCLKDCEENFDCRMPDYECYDIDLDSNLECAPVGNGDGEVGDPCSSYSDCAGGQLGGCFTEYYDWRYGYCFLNPCSEQSPCESGSHCVDSYCLKNCDGYEDCREDGYSCIDIDTDYRGECYPYATGLGEVGDPCDGIWDCDGGIYGECLKERYGWSGGYCTIICTDQASCPIETDCVDFTDISICMDSCEYDFECRQDYICVNAGGNYTEECYPEY